MHERNYAMLRVHLALLSRFPSTHLNLFTAVSATHFVLQKGLPEEMGLSSLSSASGATRKGEIAKHFS